MQAYIIPDINIVQPQGTVEGSIAVEGGRIQKIGRTAALPRLPRVKFPRGALAFPGLIDAHVHLRDMELSYKEDFRTGTRAAAKGGYTTVLDMPNTSPPTDSASRLKDKISRTRGRLAVNVGFFGALVGSPTELVEMGKLGVVGFKLYMSKPISPISIDDDQALLDICAEVAKLRLPVAVHAEDRALIESAQTQLQTAGHAGVGDFLAAHDSQVELSAIRRILRIAAASRCSIHVCHTSLPESVALIFEQKRAGTECTCEVTAHHLLLSVRELRRKRGLALMVPPLRARAAQAKLWQQLAANQIDIIASDHAPHTMGEKSKSSVWEISPGIPGLETTLPLLLTEFASRKMGYERLAILSSSRPAEVFGLRGKGVLREGFDADITIVDPSAKTIIDPAEFESKAKFSPFEGKVCKGRAIATIVAGQIVMNYGQILDEHAGTVVQGSYTVP